MKLKTKIPVAYNSGLIGQTTSIVEGELMNCSQSIRADFQSAFVYEYKSEDGTIISSQPIFLTKEETNNLYEEVKTEIPLGLSYTNSTEYLYYLGMKIKMAETFSITIDNIEIITE
jgi:hypothetical protein